MANLMANRGEPCREWRKTVGEPSWRTDPLYPMAGSPSVDGYLPKKSLRWKFGILNPRWPRGARSRLCHRLPDSLHRARADADRGRRFQNAVAGRQRRADGLLDFRGHLRAP